MFFFGLKVLEERLPNKKLMSAAVQAAGAAVARPWGGGGQARRRRRRRGWGGGAERRLFGRRNLFGFASSNGRQRGRKWEAHGLNHSMGGEGKGGVEKAASLLPGEQPPRILHLQSPVPCYSHLASSRESGARPPLPLPLRPQSSHSEHLCSRGPRPARTLGPPGRWRPGHPIGGRGRALRAA